MENLEEAVKKEGKEKTGWNNAFKDPEEVKKVKVQESKNNLQYSKVAI